MAPSPQNNVEVAGWDPVVILVQHWKGEGGGVRKSFPTRKR